MKLINIAIWICEGCLEGKGEVCHTPGCALCGHKVDLPVRPESYEVLEIDEAEEEA